MREDRTPRDGLRVVAVTAALGLAAIAALAQRHSFNPSIRLGVFNTDNVRYLGDSNGFEDSGYQLGLDLPVERTLKKGRLSFRQSVTTWRHDEFKTADFESYITSLSLATQPSSTSSFRIKADYILSQDQGRIDSLDEADLIVQQRLERESTSVNVSYDKQLRNRWGWNVSGGAASWSFERVSGFQNDPAAVPVEDRTSFHGALGLTRALSRTASMGLSYGYRRFDLDFSGDEGSHSLSLTWSKEVVDRLTVDLSVGGFASSGVAAEGPRGNSSNSRSGVQASLGLQRSWRYSSLSLTLTHSPSAGGARIGTSDNTAVALSVSGSRRPQWRWGLAIRYARRDPSSPLTPEIDSLGVAARIERRFGQVIGVRLNGIYVDQSGDRPSDAAVFLTPGLNLIWYPLGRRGEG